VPSSPPPLTRTDWVDDRLRAAILTGSIAPGERVPVERLANAWGVSATPIRESLRRLAGEGLITLLPQRGARVATIDARLAADIYGVRVVLEPMALRQSMLCAARSPIEHASYVDEVIGACDRLFASHASIHDVAEAHREFHRVLLSRCPNRVLVEQIEQLTDRSRLFRLLGAAPTRPGDPAAEHRAIADVAVGRDVEAAVEALTAHLVRTLEVVDRLAEKQI